MTAIAFVVGLLVGACIGFIIGASPAPDHKEPSDK